MKGRVLILCLAAALVLGLGGAASAADTPSACTWGASSVVAEFENGELVVSEPATSGCIP